MKTLLQLGGSVDQLFMVRTAQEMGLGVVVLDGNPEAPGLKLADHSAPIDFSKLPEVFEYVDTLLGNGIDVAGVSTMGSDVPHLVAGIASHYGWPGISIETGNLATDKYAMKQCLQKAGISVPRFSLVESSEAAINQWEAWSCPSIIMKPTDRAGSRGVRLISKKNNCKAAFLHAKESGKSGNVLIEEFVRGPQISTETILHDGRAMTPGFADRVYDGMEVFHPQIMENGGWVPTRHSNAVINQVCSLVEDAARAMGIQSGVAKGDIVLDEQRGPMVIEIAARLSGGDFCESLVPLGTGINYVQDVIRLAVGETPNWSGMISNKTKTVANRYLFLPTGILQNVSGLDVVTSMPEVKKLELFYDMNSHIPIISNHAQRVGVFIVVGDSHESVQIIIDRIYETLKFNVDGKWYFGRAVVQ